MAVGTYVGDFNSQIVAGTQDITTYGSGAALPDLSAAPAGSWALIVWRAGAQSTTGVWGGSVNAGVGFTTGASASCCTAVFSNDGSAASVVSRRVTAKLVSTIYTSGTAYDEADFTSMLAGGGFRLTWAHTAGLGAYRLCFKLITGLTGSEAGIWDGSSVASKTGLTFSPDLVLASFVAEPAGALPQATAHGYFGFGAFNKHGQQWTNSVFMKDNVNPSNTSRWQQTDAAIAIVNENETTVTERKFVSMDTYGWTMSGAPGYRIPYLALKGVSSKIGAFTKSIAAAPVTQVVDSRQGFTPKGALFCTFQNAPAGAPLSHALWSLGATDLTNHRAAGLGDQDALTPTNAKSSWYNTASLLVPDLGAPYPVATVSAVSTSTFSASWTVNNSVASEMLYCLIGDTGFSTTPQTVAT